MMLHSISASWPGLSRPSTPFLFVTGKAWMPGSRPGMTEREALMFVETK
jgi:hypothetical protein